MNARQLTNALKSPSGRMVGFFLLIILAIALIGYFAGGPGDRKPGAAAPERPLTEKVTPPEQTTSYTQERPFQPARSGPTPPPARRTAQGATDNPEPEGPERKRSDALLGIQVYAEPVAAVTPAPPAGPPVQTIGPNERYAETGRYLWCELSFAVQNSSLETPITGRVVKALLWAGKVVIPENTEVLGKARSDRVNDRIGALPNWTLVIPPFDGLPRGGTLVVRAIACDHINDVMINGSSGLHGKVLSATSTKEEIQFFAANLVVGAMNGLTPQQQTVYGSQIVPGFKSALYQAIGTSAERYADRIFEIIRKEGFYVLVPPGKTFYLYLDQPILLREAKIGSTLAFQPTAVGENELRRAGLPPSAETRQKPQPEPAQPEDFYPEGQQMPQPPRRPLSPPMPYPAPEIDPSKLEPATTTPPTTR